MSSVNRSSGVKALCSQLGYNETQDKDSPRHFTHLATIVRQFRRKNKAYDTPTCALEFCKRIEKDKSYFTRSREAKKNGWLVLPDNKDRIIETITRLIYVQESNSREAKRTTRNRNTLLGLLNNDKPSEPELYPVDQDRGSLESSTNVGTANNTLVRIKREEIDLAEEGGLGETQSEDGTEENTQSKINEHLTWAYPKEEDLKHEYLPCDIRRDACPTRHQRLTWLFQADPNAHWPDEPRSHVWRYMHHKSVYSLAPEFDEIHDLANDLIRHLQITCNPIQFSTIFDKLKHSVAFWTRTWLDYGILQIDKGFAILRSNEFKSQLKSRQIEWLTQKERLSESSSKRAGEPVCRPPLNKRRRTYIQRMPTVNSNHNGECASISRDGSTEVTILDATEVGSLGEPIVQMSPEALIYMSDNNVYMDPTNRKTPAVNGIIAAAGGTKFVSTHEVERHFKDSRGTPANHIDGPIPLPPVSKSYGLPSFGIEGSKTPQIPITTSRVVNQSASRDYQIPSSRVSQEPPKIKLFLQKTNGEIDFQNPLPSRDFKDATVLEFFAMFSERSGLNASLVQNLTFVVAFVDNLPLEVNRSDDERKWLNLKRRLSYLFKEAIAKRPQETEFEVWVVEDSDLAGL